ncbi:P2R1A-PPP2R2A-interacting phosphatase regulator 1 [Pholidichthys leucotaenia]
MERMEVDQCAGAAGGAGGGGALRRSNSAPMITSVSDGMSIFSPVSMARYRRSSVSINPTCPSQLLSPFSLTAAATDRLQDHKRTVDGMETVVRGSLHRLSPSSLIPVPPVSQWDDLSSSEWFPCQDSGVTPNSSPSPTRRFRPALSTTVRWPALTPLKRKGGAESDGPPKKLFVAGVTDPTRRNSYTVSVSSSSADAPTVPPPPTATPPAGGSSPQSAPLSLSPPPSFTPFTPHHRPTH